MGSKATHTWQFRARFRKNAFGWRSQPAITRIKEAVSEIKKVGRKDKVLAAEGAVLFLEKVSPALEQVDSSSGAIGTAVNNAIVELVQIIASAPADPETREKWLQRLFQAHADDDMPYIEQLADYWGELCASPELARELGGPADRHHPNGPQPRQGASRPLPRHDGMSQRAVRSRAATKSFSRCWSRLDSGRTSGGP